MAGCDEPTSGAKIPCVRMNRKNMHVSPDSVAFPHKLMQDRASRESGALLCRGRRPWSRRRLAAAGRTHFAREREDDMAPSFVEENENYEAWLHTQCDVVKMGLKAKHKRMATHAFDFLRATYFRWASGIKSELPELADTPIAVS